MKRFVFSLFSWCFFSCLVAAQPLTSSPSKSESIEKLFAVIGIDRQMSGGFEAMLPVVDQLAGQLQLDEAGKEQLKEAYRDWFDNDVDRAAIKSKLVALYSETFNEGEVTELIRFYQTPVGQKFLKESPELMQIGAQIGMEEAQSKQHLLMQRLQPFLNKQNVK